MSVAEIAGLGGLYVVCGIVFVVICADVGPRTVVSLWLDSIDEDEAVLAASIVLVLGWPVLVLIGTLRCVFRCVVSLRHVPTVSAYLGRGFALLLGIKRKANLPKARVVR